MPFSDIVERAESAVGDGWRAVILGPARQFPVTANSGRLQNHEVRAHDGFIPTQCYGSWDSAEPAPTRVGSRYFRDFQVFGRENFSPDVTVNSSGS